MRSQFKAVPFSEADANDVINSWPETQSLYDFPYNNPFVVSEIMSDIIDTLRMAHEEEQEYKALMLMKHDIIKRHAKLSVLGLATTGGLITIAAAGLLGPLSFPIFALFIVPLLAIMIFPMIRITRTLINPCIATEQHQRHLLSTTSALASMRADLRALPPVENLTDHYTPIAETLH